MKKLFIIIVILMLSGISFAETVSTDRAIDVARKWYQHLQPQEVPVSQQQPSQPLDYSVSPIEEIQTEQYNNQDTFYIVRMTEGGFVLVSAEDAIIPILGYSFDTEMDQASINPAARQLLNYYSMQIADAVARGITMATALDEWQSIENDSFNIEGSALSSPAMPPLISTQWGQSPRYNLFTPDETPTGCVATAMAQIMKYYNYPESGVGEYSYTHVDYGVLSANFNTTYHWTQMPDSLSSSSSAEEISAVATLMYHCGISVEMDYAPDSSGASSQQVPLSLHEYFGYSASGTYKNKDDYTDQEWTNMLIAELDAFRPLHYSGRDSNGSNGHAFICDGYQGTDYFHFNWGWSGSNDGYYRLSLLDPSSYDFSYSQGAVFGVQPEKIYERIAIVSEDFEDTFPPTGWTQEIVVSGSPSPEWSQTANGITPNCTPLDGSKMIQFNANETTDGAKARLRLPSIDLSNMNYPRLSFMMYHEDSNSSITSEGITVQLSVNGTDWTDLKFYPRYIMTTGWQTYRIDLTYYTGQTVYIGFVGHSGNGSNIYLDRIETNYAGPTSGMTMETLISYAGASISFTDDSFQASTYSWDFGDTSTSTTQNVSHIYANPGIYTIVHSINSSASSTTQTIQILPVITPSYLPEHGGDFESNFNHFGTQLLGGNTNLWELGQPGNTISDTASGVNVWKTDLDSNLIEDYQVCALYSPEFDLSATGSYAVAFKYRMQIYYSDSPGAAWMEYSTDQGKTWQRLGAKTGNPDGTQNWYNTENNSIAPDGICWWHDRTEYTQAIYNLSNFMGEPHMAFRWIYQVEPGWSAEGYNIDGFAVDDFSLEYEAPTADFTMDRECSYVGKNITFTDTSTFPTDWSWDFGDSTTSISQNPTHAYTSPGNYTITLSINNSASQVSQCITILPVMTPSYLPADGGDFESNPQHFFSNIIDGEINLWERGIPSNTISDTASGLNVWKTDLDSNIQQANYTCVLNTPAFDLSLTGNYYVKFQYRMEIYYGNCPGSAWLEYSIDKGDTWQRLGADTGNPEGTQNWYNKNDHDVAPDGICWWHTKSSYTQAIYSLIDFLGETSICFRFVYKVAGNWSAEGYNIDGFAIDDFTLEYVPPTADFQITSDVYYAGVPIQLIDQSTFPDNWAWNFQGMTSTSQSVTHTFASPGDYTVSLSINNNASMTSKVIRVLPTIKPSYTTLDGGDFESNALHFSPAVISGTINLWEHGTPSNIISDTASGTNVWKTDLDANIQKADYTCVLYTPNFDFSRSGEYYLKFKYRMHITAGNCPGAGWMDYSTDSGNTWQKLGAYTDNPDGTQEWYNQYEHDIAPDGVCWWGIKSTYSQVIYNLSEYAGNSNISFRFVLMVQGNWSGGYDSDGWSIDDFEIEHQTNAPTILPLIQDQTINEDSSFTPITLDNHVSDTNHLASEITWSTSGSDHLSVNIDTSRIATISINAPDWNGFESIIFTATDPEGMTDTDLVVFTVISVNDPPTIANAIPDQTADQDVPFSFTFGSNIFEDVDAGDNLTYTATLNDGNPLPSWLTFNSFTRTFNGTPTNNDGGTITIIVTAEDSFSESVSDAFDLTVSNATSKYWVISDSPASYNSNTWTENNWTEINVSNENQINNWSIIYTWSADSYPEEASFFVLSPSGTQYTIASGETSGTYTVTTSKFVGEPAYGQWRVWIEDSCGDGGCGASNINMSIEFLGAYLTVILPESTDEGIGSITGTVTASSIPEENLTVYLYSNNPGRLTVASETIIQAGEDHADFTISIIDDLLLNGSSDVQVMAYASEYYTRTSIIQVNDNESTVLSIVLPYSANGYEQYIQGAFIVDQAVDCNVDIHLISSEPNILSVQEMVTIPSGLTEVTFQLTIHNFTVAQAISITATVANWIINDDTINLIPSMISESQRQALIDLYNSTDGSSWSNSDNWLGARGTECSWYGVTCDDYESNVIRINLSYNNLIGDIPGSISNLQDLSELYLYDNQLSSLPDSFGNLQYLSELYLYNNQLSSLPDSFGNLQNLSELYLYNNQLSSLPESFGNLQNLFDLDLSNNPPSIDTISNQLTSENKAIHSISMTVSDLNDTSCNMTLNMTSSNPSLIPNEYILYECQQNQYTMVVMPAFNQTGTTEISLTIVNGYDLAATTAFQITVNDVDESRYQWGNFQAAESILGQSDFSSNLSGTTTSNFSFPNHIAVDPTTGKVFVSEDQNHRILRFSSTASLINGSSAEAVFGQADFVSGSANRSGSPDANTLANPSGIFVDAFGHLWVADSNNHRVLKFDHAASKINGANADAVFGQADFISNASQTSQNQMDHPQSVWVDPAGRLWVADYNNNRVLRFDHAASKTNGANADGVLGQSDYTSNTSGTTQSLMNGPSFVSGNNAGTLFVCSTLSHRVLRFDNAASKTNGANADGVLGQTDFTSDTSDTTSNRMNEPTGIALDYVGHLYVSDKGNNRVLIFQDVVNKLNGDDADYVLGQSDFISNTPNNGGISEKTFNMPNGLFFDNENCYLWTADSQNHRVLRYLMARSTTTQISFTIPDSPASYTSNTWTENNWTEINVSNDQIIINWSIAYVWSADNYPEEASFLVLSPSGTQYIIASGETSGTYTKTTNSFNGEPANGQWRLWIEDSNSDGGCQALTLTMSIETTNSLPQLSVISNVNTLENLSTSLFFSLTDTVDGIISLTPYSSDNNLVCSDNILLTHVSMMHESETYTLSVTAGIPETITLTMIPSNNLYGKTQIDVILSNAFNLTALTSFTLTIVESAARSVELDGIDDHIITNSDMTIAPTNAISIEAWIYLYTNTTDLAILSCGNDSHQSITFEHGLHNLDMRLRNAGNIDMIVVHDVSASPLPLNQWHHVCAVWDNTTNIGKLYVNGICVYYATFVSDTIGYSNARKLYMGSCFGLQKFFKGRLDEVRFWRTALQEQTIREWRFKTLTNEHPDFDQLIAYYPFSAVDGTLVFDLIGNHHGYLYNNTTAAVGPTRQVWIPFNSWLNSNNNDWNNPINWEAEFVPNKTNPGYVFINAGMRKPVLSAPSSINNLVLDKGASYQASNVNSLNIFGKFYNQMNTVNIDIGSSLTVFSSMDFKTDRIAPVLENKSLSITTNASEFNIQWEQATDEQTSLLNLEYAVIMSSYSRTCLESLGLIAANITPCEIETLIPFQTVSGSGNGETVRSIAGNFAEVNISGLSGGTYYFNVLVRDEMNNMAVYDAQN